MKHIDIDARGRTYMILREYGLKPYKARKGVKAFRGELQCAKATVAVHLEIEDWDFTQYPRITLLERPASLPALIAHVDATGGLCYFMPESVILDRYRPDVAVEQCLQAAIKVLDDVLSGKPQKDDIANEFAAYWTFGQSPEAWPVLVDDVLMEETPKASYFFLKEDGQLARGLIAKDVSAARRLTANIDAEELVKGSLACLLFETAAMPAVPPTGLPRTIREFFNWVREWDKDLYSRIQQRLGSDKTYLTRGGCVIAIFTPAGGLGVQFLLDRRHRLGYANAPRQFRQFLHGAGGVEKVTRLKLDHISAEYIHTRNLHAYPSLVGRRIKIVGCGAIGGYVAAALVRLGAGTGEGGLLRLYDFGDLEPDNLGRHALGFTSLYQNKAVALRQELLRQFPYVNTEALPEAPSLTDEFFSTDLVIDCTGSEAANERLNAHHVKSRLCPVLYVCIRGNGECVQALWVDASNKLGCYRCLRQAFGANYFEERFPVLEHAAHTRFLGCRSFTPYAVSSPMYAATLATDVVIDWLKGDPSPRFRTRYVENADVRKVKNQDLGRIKECPACSGN
ncbi:hypothetical protein BTHE68_40110 [Burkholderia sp. THE68]|uniref:ThiF family adenylyltransferase n=1 Tax=Burkholderia sp. THE68 TaxID=758782 RepID=UPI00131715A8|nr:ThiF family adenylyltransferase [Burkholderia sp. THE68]BBU30277.1 hypothetical protein BTHE68_40110 [Burkholderia sp. THE68]